MFIYIATNTVNSKRYVGQTHGMPIKRWQKHVSVAHKHQAGSPLLSNAIRKYGADSFVLRYIELPTGVSQALLDRCEIQAIAKLKTLVPHGYNLTEGGRGGKPSDETRERMRAAKLGAKNANFGKAADPVRIANMVAARKGMPHPMLGKPMSDITKAKLSAALQGKAKGRKCKPFSEQHRAHLRESHLGTVASFETRAKQSAVRKGRKRPPRSEEHKANLSKALTGKKQKPRSVEHRAKISASNRRRVLSDATKAKISLARKGKGLGPRAPKVVPCL